MHNIPTTNKDLGENMAQERAKAISGLVKRHFQKLESKGELSGAHSFGHVSRVATYAGEIASALGADERTQELAKVAGYLHDFVRNKAEQTDAAFDDEVLAAQQAKPLLEGLGKSQKDTGYQFTPEEVSTVTAAIKTHTVPKDILADEKTRHTTPQGRDLVRLAVWLADKTEANGHYVVARRGQFVAGERYHDGDLKKWRESLPAEVAVKVTPAIAFLLETYVRRYVKNDASQYPKWYKPVSSELFGQQRQFVKALYAATGLTEEDVEHMIVQHKYPGVTKEQMEKAVAARPARNDAISTEEILKVSPEHSRAALRMVAHFSSPKHRGMDTAKAILAFKPESPGERDWHQQMKGYLGGNLKPIIKEISKHVEREERH